MEALLTVLLHLGLIVSPESYSDCEIYMIESQHQQQVNNIENEGINLNIIGKSFCFEQ